MSGSHWVATYVKNGIISYFDSFGMPPFQEILNHARKKKHNIIISKQSDTKYYDDNLWLFLLAFI